jgi:hypothetical protein
MVIALSLLVCVVGLVIYLAASPMPNKFAQIGISMFQVGLLAFLLRMAGHAFGVLPQ